MSTAAQAPPARSPWLFGPVVDLTIGAGGIYLVIAFALTLAMRADFLDATGAATLALIIGGPHYGATLLRAYGTPDARAAYKSVGTYATIVLVALVVLSLWLPLIGAALVTLYFSWVGWHYSAQCYGVTRIFLARRGVTIDEPTRKALYGSFVASAALTFASIHTERPGRPPTPPDELYAFLRLGIPLGVGIPLITILAVTMIGLLVFSGSRIVRAGASPTALAPALILSAVHLTWFALPVIAIRSGVLTDLIPFNAEAGTSVFIYIALTHSLQHLWVALYHARKQTNEAVGRHFMRALAAGSLVWAIPGLLLPLGPVPLEMGVAVLILAAVNVHHFALDGVVWKLRDAKNSSLVNEVAAKPPRVDPDSALVFAGALALVAQVAGIVVSAQVATAAASHDGASLDRVAPIARILGRDGPDLRRALAEARVTEGRCDDASAVLAGMPSEWPIDDDVRASVASCGTVRPVTVGGAPATPPPSLYEN